MKNIAPNIVRQRLLIEGLYQTEVNEDVIKNYFIEITKALSLRMHGEPIVFSPSGVGKSENQGYDAFVPLIDSGISLYVWSSAKFLSLIIYTCKSFDSDVALRVTKEFFKIKEIESMGF